MTSICHVVYECIPDSFAGGVQKMVYELATAQAAAGQKVEIWTIGKAGRRELQSNLCIRYFPGRVRWGSAALGAALLAERNQFDVIHGHNTFLPLNRQVAAAGRAGARVFFNAHGALDPNLLTGWNLKAAKKRPYVAYIEKRNYAVARGLIGLTEVECGQLDALHTGAPVFHVSNGIRDTAPSDAVEAVAFRLRLRIEPGQPVILFIGRITHKKGLHYMLSALPAVREAVPNALFVICGGREHDREYVASLDRQIEKMKLQSAVRWAGFLDENGKRAAYPSGAVFVHPSYSEGMALAVLEAMIQGIPTLVTPGCYMGPAARAGVIEEVAQDPGEIAQSLIRLLQDRNSAAALGRRGQEYARKYYSWGSVASRLAGIYSGDPAIKPFIPGAT